jgi:hypothetical protein
MAASGGDSAFRDFKATFGPSATFSPVVCRDQRDVKVLMQKRVVRERVHARLRRASHLMSS